MKPRFSSFQAETYYLRNEIIKLEAALQHLKTYFEENHAERIKYPEYLEFHEYKMILDALRQA
jgi:hypothetical protein